MNLAGVKRWLAAALDREDLHGRETLSDAAATLAESAQRSARVYTAFEGSLSSIAPERIQLTHLHIDLRPQAASPGAQLKKAGGALAALSRLDHRWSGEPAKSVLCAFCAQGTIASGTLFSCEYDAKHRAVVKATLYSPMSGPSALMPTMRILRMSSAGLARFSSMRGYDCFGVDFFPRGKPRVKIYEFLGGVDEIGPPLVRNLCREIASRVEVRHVLQLRRLDPGGEISEPSRYVLRLGRGIPGEELSAFAPLSAYRSYFSRVRRLLEGQTAYYLRFDSTGRIGLDVRSGRAPWPSARDR